MKFMNSEGRFYSQPHEEEQGGEQGGGGGGGAAPFKSFATQKELDDYIKSQQKSKDEDDQSIFDKRRNDEEEKKNNAESVKRIQSAVVFDTSFDNFIKENKEYFPESVSTIRNDVKSDDAVEKANLIAATAAKEYFSIKSNLDSLTTADRERVQREIMDVRFEQQIDGLKVWELVQRSIYGHGLMNSHKRASDFMGKDGTGSTGFKNVDNYLKNFFPETVVSVPN